MDDDERVLAELRERQSGVVSRRQLLELGLDDNDIRRLVRRREWTPLHTGVYLDHTGRPSWMQRAWGAVLWCAPAALCRESARRVLDGPGRREYDDRQPIHVAIDHSRVVRAPAGIVVHRTVNLDAQVLWNTSPPRQRIEDASIDLATGAGREIDAVAFLADPVGARLTTGTRLADALARRSRVRRRAFLASVIDDIACGTCSTLEHGYLSLVERPHGLPTARRQFRVSRKGPSYRDADYEPYATVVELDGRLFHSKVRDRDRDLERDLDAAVDGAVTARLGWGQVFDRPCSTAFKVGSILGRHGWRGSPRPCPRCPDLLRRAA